MKLLIRKALQACMRHRHRASHHRPASPIAGCAPHTADGGMLDSLTSRSYVPQSVQVWTPRFRCSA